MAMVLDFNGGATTILNLSKERELEGLRDQFLQPVSGNKNEVDDLLA